MRIVYMGTPEFAKNPLERLYSDGNDIVGVFTQPDRPKNRGMKLAFSPVKEFALEHNIPVYQPDTLRDGQAVEILSKLEIDLIAVVAYGKLLPREILDLPPLGCVNVHASILPKYRGAAPIQWAIINGETETGVTSMYMAEELDAGDVLLTKKTPIGEDETSGQLHDRLSISGAEVLSETVTKIAQGKIVRTPQDNALATFAPQLSKSISQIDWGKTAREIKCKVRGLNPWPVATAEFGGVIYKIFSVDIEAKSGNAPGEIVSADARGFKIACLDGTINVRELQAPNGKRMSAADYLRGREICR